MLPPTEEVLLFVRPNATRRIGAWRLAPVERGGIVVGVGGGGGGGGGSGRGRCGDGVEISVGDYVGFGIG